MARPYKGRVNQRAQAPELAGPERLQSPGLPSSTYAPPPKPPQDERMARLADALGVFNSALSRFGTAAMKAYQKQQADIDRAIADRTIAGHTNEEYKELVRTGRMPAVNDPMARAALDKHTGQVIGDEIGNRIRALQAAGQINLADPNFDADQLLTQLSREAMEGPLAPFVNNPAAMAGFRGRIDSYRDSLLNEQGKAIGEKFKLDQLAMARTQFHRIFDMAADLNDPAVTQNFIRSVYKEVGTRSPSGLPHPELDKTLLDVLKERAHDPKTVDHALHVLWAEREGGKLPPIGTNPKHVASGDIEEILKIGRNTLAKRNDARAEELATKTTEEAIERGDGSVWGLTDQTYTNPITNEEKVISARKAKELATTRILTRSRQQQQDRGESWQTRFDREWDMFSRSGILHPEWKATLEGAATSFTDPASLTDPATREKVIGAAHVYRTIAERNYAYTKNVLKLDRKAQDFYEVFDVARTGMGRNDDEALYIASQAIRNIDNENDLGIVRAKAKEVQQKLSSTNWRESGFINMLKNLAGGEYAENTGAVRKRVNHIASLLVRVPGIDADTAIEKATEIVRQRSLFINGHLVPDDMGPLPDGNYRPYIEKALNNFVEKHGKRYDGLTKGTQLTVMPHGGGHLAIVRKDAPFPLPLNIDGAPAIITRQHLEKLREEDDALAAKKREMDNARRRQIRRDAHEVWDTNVYPQYTPERPAPMTKEEEEKRSRFHHSLRGFFERRN